MGLERLRHKSGNFEMSEVLTQGSLGYKSGPVIYQEMNVATTCFCDFLHTRFVAVIIRS